MTFSTEEAIRLADDAEYVFTQNLNRGLRMGEKLETGMLGLNVGDISDAARRVKQSGWVAKEDA